MIRFRPREYHIAFCVCVCVCGRVCDRLETMQAVSILFESIRIFKGKGPRIRNGKSVRNKRDEKKSNRLSLMRLKKRATFDLSVVPLFTYQSPFLLYSNSTNRSVNNKSGIIFIKIP